MEKRKFSKEEKLKIIQEYEKNPTHAFKGNGHAITTEARNAELERTVGRLYLENEFLKNPSGNKTDFPCRRTQNFRLRKILSAYAAAYRLKKACMKDNTIAPHAG